MRELVTTIKINAPAHTVWEALTKFEDYASWNPFIRQAEGQVKLGEVLRVKIQPSGGREMRFTPRVVEVEPGRKFAWLGKLFIRGLFDGRHEFAIHETENGVVEFVHSERFTGILVPVIWGYIEKGTRKGFEEMNEALKTRAEGN
jgi:hypothetical protein